MPLRAQRIVLAPLLDLSVTDHLVGLPLLVADSVSLAVGDSVILAADSVSLVVRRLVPLVENSLALNHLPAVVPDFVPVGLWLAAVRE
jgi:hypothetical protein